MNLAQRTAKRQNWLHKSRLARPIPGSLPHDPTQVCRHPGFAEGEDLDPESPGKQSFQARSDRCGELAPTAPQKYNREIESDRIRSGRIIVA
jgi:hypothetical protein